MVSSSTNKPQPQPPQTPITTFKISTTPSFSMYTKALLVLAPVAAQAATAQSARWPVFNLRANVTEQYIGYGQESWDRRQFWHNAPFTQSGGGEITGPLVDNECNRQRAGLNDHGKYMQLLKWKCQNMNALLILNRSSVLRALFVLLKSHFQRPVRAHRASCRLQKDQDRAKEPERCERSSRCGM